jgi:hypothetical protein
MTMSKMLDAVYSTSGFTSENSLSGHPHTPPYTPSRLRTGKRSRIERSDSPVSISGSIHPTETASPASKPTKPAKKRIATDSIKVEELTEAEIGYMGDVDVVFPEDTDSAESSDEHSAGETATAADVSDEEAAGLARKLAQVKCTDDREALLEQRRQRRRERRANTNQAKRSHSQAVKYESDTSDTDALADHDLQSSSRRLRRRTRGPDDLELDLSACANLPSDVGQASPSVQSTVCGDTTQPGDAMDVESDMDLGT